MTIYIFSEKWIRLFVSICFIYSQSIGVPVLGEDRNLAFYQPYQPQSYQHDYQPTYNPRLNELNSFIPRIQFSPIPDLNIGIATARIPKFDVRDVDNSFWSYNFEPVKFDDRRVTSFQATIDLPTNHQLGVEMKDISYRGNIFTPQKFTETYHDDSGQSLIKNRRNQTAIQNPSLQKYQEYLRQNYPDLLMNPSQVRPAGLSPQPSRELVQGFEEKWTFEGDHKIGEPKVVSFDVDNLGYDQGRYLNHYAGSVSKGDKNLMFTVDAPRSNQGEIEAIKIHIQARGTPSAEITWNPKSSAKPSQSFELLRENLPVPLLVGFRTGIRLNDVDLAQVPLKVTSEGKLSANQLGSAKDIVNMMGKSDLGLEVNFLPPTKENQKSDFSFKNGVQNLWYMVTGRWSEVKGMRDQLGMMQNQEPGKFILSAGFQDPGFMGIKDLREALNTSKSFGPNLFQNSPSANKPIPSVGVFKDGNGNEIYRSISGREINITQVKELTAFTQKALVPDVNKNAEVMKNSLIELGVMVKENQGSMKNRTNEALRKDNSTAGEIKRFFVGTEKVAPKGDVGYFSGLTDGIKNLTQQIQAQQKSITNEIEAAKSSLSHGDYEAASEHMSKGIDEALTAKAVYAEGIKGISTVKDSLEKLDHAQKYVSGNVDPVPPIDITTEDVFRVLNPFFASDPDVKKVQNAVLQEAPKGSQAVAQLADLGLIDQQSADRLQHQLSSKQKDVIRGFSNLDKNTSSRVLSAVQLADVTEDVIGGVVLGATMKNESTISVMAGTAIYFTPMLGPVAITRDLLAEAYKGNLVDNLRGAILGSYLSGDEATPSAIRGTMVGYVASMGLSAARDVSHAIGTLSKSNFSDGKTELALAAMPFFFHGAISGEGTFKSLSEYKQLSTYTRVQLQVSKLTTLKGIISDAAVNGETEAMTAVLQRKVNTVEGTIAKLKARTILDLPNIGSDFKIVRRPGLPERSLYESWIKGQLTDQEWNDVRTYAMNIKKNIPICGSLAETDLGMSRRYELKSNIELKNSISKKYGIPEYRANKPESDLIKGTQKADVDIWAGSNLSQNEYEKLRTNVFHGAKIDLGYSLERYPNLESLRGESGVLIFNYNGTVTRIPSNWQLEKY